MDVNRQMVTNARRHLILAIGCGAAVLGICFGVYFIFREQNRSVRPTENNYRGLTPSVVELEKLQSSPFIVVPGAQQIAYSGQSEEGQLLTYEVNELFPADKSVSTIVSEMRKRGWTPCNAPGPQWDPELRRYFEWTEQIVSDRYSEFQVRQWSGNWENPKGERIYYGLEYCDAGPEILTITATWCSAKKRKEIDEAMKRAWGDRMQSE